MSFGKDLREKVLLDDIVLQKQKKRRKEWLSTTGTFIKGSQKYPLNSIKTRFRKLHVIIRGHYLFA
jgi:hypothetical protein